MLNSLLRYGHFWALLAQFLLLAALTASELPGLLRHLVIGRRRLAHLLMCGVLAGGLAAAAAPRTNRILYDEHIYQSVGQSLADERLAQVCADGSVSYGRLQCREGAYNKEPYGYPFLLSLAYRAAGVQETAAFVVNNVLCGLLPVIVGLIGALLFARWTAAIGGALLVVTLPAQLLWANTAASETSAECFTALAVLTSLYFCRVRTTRSLWWMVAATAFAMNMRPESLLTGGLVALIVVICARAELWHRRIWYAGAAVIAMNAVLVAHWMAVRNLTWEAPGPRFSVAYLAPNLTVNGLFYLWDERFPLLLTLLAAFGAWRSNHRRAIVVLSAYFALFWTLFLFFYAGSYSYGANTRYSLLTYPPLCVLGGLGLAALRDMVGRHLTRRRFAAAAGAMVAVQVLFNMPLVRAVGEESWSSRADIRASHDIAARLPRDSFVFTQNPSVFLLNGVDAGQMTLAAANHTPIELLTSRYPGGVYLYWNYWCNNVDARELAICNDALARFSHEVVSERVVRDFRYTLYRLQAPTVQVAQYVPPASGAAGRPQKAEGGPGIPR